MWALVWVAHEGLQYFYGGNQETLFRGDSLHR